MRKQLFRLFLKEYVLRFMVPVREPKPDNTSRNTKKSNISNISRNE